MRRFGGENRTERKQTIIEKVVKFFEKYFGLFGSKEDDDEITYVDNENIEDYLMVAEDEEEYKIEDNKE